MKLKIEFKHNLTVIARGTIEVELYQQYYMDESAKEAAEHQISSAMLTAERSINSLTNNPLSVRISES